MGISLPALQRLLGHLNLTTTEIYLNLSPEDVSISEVVRRQVAADREPH